MQMKKQMIWQRTLKKDWEKHYKESNEEETENFM